MLAAQGSLLRPWHSPAAASPAELARAWWSTLAWAHAACIASNDTNWHVVSRTFQKAAVSVYRIITTNTTSPKIQEKYYIVHMPAAVHLCVCRPFSIGVASRKNHHEHCWTFHTSVWAIAGAQAKALDESPNWLMVMPLDYFFGDFRWFQYPVPMSKFHLGKKGLLSQGYWERSHRSSRGRAIYILYIRIYTVYIYVYCIDR